MTKTRNKVRTKDQESSDSDDGCTRADIMKELKEMRKSLSFISTMFEEMRRENAELKKKVNEEIKQRKKLAERVGELEEALEGGERDKIKNNIVMSGIERQDRREKAREVVMKVIRAMKLNINEHEILNARRMDENRDNSPIVVEMKTREVQTEIIKARKTIGSITTTECELKGKNTNIYINEQLTRRMSGLFYKAREAKKEKQYKFLWTRENKIYMKKTETSTKIRIRNNDDLETLQ